MSWTSFETPDGREVEAWLVTDEADTPGGADARRGQWVIRESKIDTDGRPFLSFSVVDQPEPTWKVTAVAPESTPSNSPIQVPEDPRADLWGKSDDELMQLAAQLEMEFNPNMYPTWRPRRSMIYQIDAKRRGMTAVLERRPEPLRINPEGERPHPGPASAVEIDPGPFEG